MHHPTSHLREVNMEVYLEPTDVARKLGIAAPTVKAAAAAGRLRVAAVTRRGVRLFLPQDVDRYRRVRAAVAKARSKFRAK